MLGILLLGAAGCGEDMPPAQDCTDPQGQPVAIQINTTASSQFLGTRPANVTWVAAQDASCGWQRVDGVQGQYTFNVRGGRYGVAVVCSETDANGSENDWLSIFYLTTADATALRFQCFQPLPDSTPTHDLAITLQETLPLAVRYFIREQQSDFLTLEGGTETDTFQVASGTHDVVVGSYQDRTLEKLQFWRDLDGSQDNSLNIDVNAPGWIRPGSIQVTTERKQGELVAMNSSYLTNHRTRVHLAEPIDVDTSSAGTVSFQTPSVPTEDRQGDELHHFEVDGTPGTFLRSVETYLRSPGSTVSLQLPEGSRGAAVTCDAAGRCTVRFNMLPNATDYVAGYSRGTQSVSQQVHLTASAGYQGTASTLPFPDFTGVPGWNPAWAPVASQGSWSAATVGNDRGFPGELAVLGATHDDQSLSDLDGLTRWSIQEPLIATAP